MDRTGQIIDGKYKLVRMLGEGGMGSVYEAEHVVINRRCAVKFLHPELATNAEVVKRFIREAQAASAVRHKGIVDIYDVGTTADGAPYLVMEFLDGCSFSTLLGGGRRLPAGEAVDVAVQALSALSVAHKHGIVHRDLKPDNLYLVQTPDSPASVKLLDFGISKLTLAGSPQDRMTRTGTVLGTPYYMSPEQAAGRPDVDHRSDLYSMGVILYEAVTGRVPFEGDNYNQLIVKIFTESFPAPREIAPDVPEALEQVILKAMDRDPGARYQDAPEMVAALVPLLEPGARISRSIPLSNTAALRHLTRTPHVSPGAATMTPAAESGRTTAGAAEPAAKSRAPAIAAIATAAVAVVAVAVVLVLRSGDDTVVGSRESASIRADAAEPAPPAVSVVAPDAPAPETASAAKPEPGPEAPAVSPAVAGAADVVRISLENLPAGAVVKWDGAVVPEVPFGVRRGEAGVVLEITAPGFQPHKQLVKPNVDRLIAVSLTPTPAAAVEGPDAGTGSSGGRVRATAGATGGAAGPAVSPGTADAAVRATVGTGGSGHTAQPAARDAGAGTPSGLRTEFPGGASASDAARGTAASGADAGGIRTGWP